jgi:hypothetical protein
MTDAKKQAQEIAALKEENAKLEERLARVEARDKPPPPEFDPWRYDPTEGMTMPKSTKRDMVNAVGDGMVSGIANRDGRAPQGPSAQGVIPSSQSVGEVRVGGNGAGWREATPIGPSMHQRYVDQQLDAADKADRAELAARLARQGGRDGS